MSNFKIDRFVNNLSENQRAYGMMLITEFRKSGKFKEENFKGSGITCGMCTITFSAKHLTVHAPIQLDPKKVSDINKKLLYKNNELKVVFAKSIDAQIMNKIVKLYE